MICVIFQGEKVFYMIKPTTANLCLYETWLNASNQSELFFGDQVCINCGVEIDNINIIYKASSTKEILT